MAKRIREELKGRLRYHDLSRPAGQNYGGESDYRVTLVEEVVVGDVSCGVYGWIAQSPSEEHTKLFPNRASAAEWLVDLHRGIRPAGPRPRGMRRIFFVLEADLKANLISLGQVSGGRAARHWIARQLKEGEAAKLEEFNRWNAHKLTPGQFTRCVREVEQYLGLTK